MNTPDPRDRLPPHHPEFAPDLAEVAGHRECSEGPAVLRSSRSSPPPRDYLRDDTASAFFDAREREAYYRSLKSTERPREARRAFHDRFRSVLLRLLALADDDGIVFLENLITANLREEKRTPGRKPAGLQSRVCGARNRKG